MKSRHRVARVDLRWGQLLSARSAERLDRRFQRAVSSLNRNIDLLNSPKSLMRIGQRKRERLERSVPVERLTWARVHAVCDGIEFFAVHGQVCAFGQVLAQQPIGVLA